MFLFTEKYIRMNDSFGNDIIHFNEVPWLNFS